jgi:Lon-like protease
MTDTQDRTEPPIAPRRAGRAAALLFGDPRFREGGPSGPPVSPFTRAVTTGVLFAVSLLMFMNRFTVPYLFLGPGPTTNVLKAITVKGAPTFPSRGQLLLTTASVGQQRMNLWDVLAVWLDADAVAVPEVHVRDPQQSRDESDFEGDADMEESKINAELAAFRALGLKVPVVSGVYVLATLNGAGAHDVLQTGDVLTKVDGKPVTAADRISKALAGHRKGDTVPVTFLREGNTLTRDVELKTTIELKKGTFTPALGVKVGTAYKFPSEVEIDSGVVGGPSGGLVFALSLADVLSEDDLTGGHTIAVTGTIGPLCEGATIETVCPIGAIEEKVRGARAAGADLFLVPKENEKAARAEAGDSIKIIAVHTLSEAIAELRKLPPKD